MTDLHDYNDRDIGSMTWEDAESRIPDADFIVLPCGSLEQHSIHLPLSVDTLRAESLTQMLVESAAEQDVSMVRLPTLPYGYSEHHMNYSGTVTLLEGTYRKVIVDIGKSVSAHQAKRLLLVNCHGGNRAPLKLASDRIQRDYELPTYFVHWTDFAREQLEAEFGEKWGHAGEHETSVIELLHSELVSQEKKEPQTRRADYDIRQYPYFDDITEQGGLGDPTNSDPEFIRSVISNTNDDIINKLQSDMAQE